MKNHKKKNNLQNQNVLEKEFILKEKSEVYGQVIAPLGNNRMSVQCFDNKIRLCIIKGSMRKKVWILKNDIVLVSLRDFQDDKGDIVHRYDDEDVKKLKNMNEIPTNLKVSTKDDLAEDDISFDFDDI